MNLIEPMHLAGQNLLDCLLRTRNYLPYFSFGVYEQNRPGFCFELHSGHNIGRWWDAMLRLEQATGFVIPPREEAAMLENLRWFFDNPDQLCLVPADLEGFMESDRVDHYWMHTLREGLLALAALARFRSSRWAVEQGRRMLESIARISRTDCGWDLDAIEYYHRLGRPELPPEMSGPNVNTNGRLIEALVWFHQTTSDPLALELADRFASHHLKHSTHPDGRLNTASNPTHTHSYLGMLRGLLLFGLLTGQREYIDAVAATYRATVRQILIKESGWVAHDLLKEATPDAASAGDVAQLALWLAHYAGHSDLLDDAERIVRARLLPCQIKDSPDMGPLSKTEGIELDRLDERFIGGFGGMLGEPHAVKRNTTDITAAVLHTLSDLYQHIAVHRETGLTVYFHFDYEDETVRIRSNREKEAKVVVIPKMAELVSIRIPQWAPTESICLTVNGKTVDTYMFGTFARVSITSLPSEIELRFALPTCRKMEKSQGIDFAIDWRGDEVMGIQPNTGFLPLYPTGRA